MVTAATQFPEEHASLSDGSTTVKFIFTDGQGKKNERAFKADPYPRTALKTTQGESKYSDLEPPYFAIAQDDFTGGRGNEDFESDTSRYSDGYYIDGTKESGVVLGGLESYSVFLTNNREMPGSVAWQTVYGSEKYIARSFVASANYTALYYKVLLKYVGSPGTLYYEIWDDSASAPNAKLSGTFVSTSVSKLGTVSKIYQMFQSQALTDGTTYWIVIFASGTNDASNHWLVGCDSTVTGKKSTAGSSWSSLSNGLYYHIIPGTGERDQIFFEYKNGLYSVSRTETLADSEFWINGDRGAADDNSGDKTWLQDSTKAGSWVDDRWIGAKVLITKGPGSDEIQPWRDITDNTTTALKVLPDWEVTHTTATEYVIIGTDYWTQLDNDLDDHITDVAVAGEFIYMAAGGVDGDNGLHRFRYWNKAGVWTAEEEATSSTLISDKLLMINHPNDGETIYSSTVAHEHNDISIYKGIVPRGAISADRYLFYPLHEFNTDVPWADKVIANVTQTLREGNTKITIAGGHTTGLAAVLNIDPLDFREADTLVAEVKSDVTLASGDYEWVYDDVGDMGKTWSPVKVFKADYSYVRPPSNVLFVVDADGATPTYTALPKVIDQLNFTRATISVTTDDLFCVGYSIPFNSFAIDFGTTVNVIADRTLTANYSNGNGWASLGATDGTKTADNGTFKTFAQDGAVTWTIPEDWVPTTINGVEAYWVTCGFDDDLTASINIKTLQVVVSEGTTMSPLYDDMSNVLDGNSNSRHKLTLGTEDYIYIGYGTKFNKATFTFSAFATENGDVTAEYYNGSAWTSVTITDGTEVSTNSFKKNGAITFTIPNDWEADTVNSTETFWIRLDTDTAFTSVFAIREITVTRQNNLNYDIPGITAGYWTTVFTNINPPVTIPDESTIKSIGLNVAVDKGACNFEIRKLWLAKREVDTADETVFRMPGGKRINGLERYAGNVDDPITNPWIFTTDAMYEMQTQNDDQIVQIPLEELGALSSSENGLGHTVNGTYLFFNIGEKIERYFNRTLDDIGPDRDEGLPDDRPGIPKSLASYPGRVYAGIDAGKGGTSSILGLDGAAWTEVYRAIYINERVRDIFIQAIPDTNVDRLWFCTNTDVGYVPISLNPYNETDYTYAHEGVLITSWIYANLVDVVKLWKSLKIFAENVDANRYIVADYQVDNETTWTEIGTFNTPPVQEIDIASTLPQSKRIRYRLRFITNDEDESPRLKAMVTEGVAFVPVKTSYSWTFAIKQDTEDIDLFGVYDLATTSVQDYDQLLTWANAGDPLTFRHHSSLYDNKKVFLNPVSVSPIKVVDHEGIENHVAALTCIEV